MPVQRIPRKKKVVQKPKKDKRANKKKPKSKKLFKKKKVIRNIHKKKTIKKKGGLASKEIMLHLGKQDVKFDLVEHRKVFTAYDLAQTLGAKLDEIAKTLLVEVEIPELGKKKKGHYVVVVPASYRVNLNKVKKALKATKVGIATEKAMLKMGMEPGAMTPFGSLRDLGVVVDKNLLKAKIVLVGAESFVESLRMKTKDLVKAENAVVDLVGDKSKLKLQKKAKLKKKPKKGTKPTKQVAKKPSKKKVVKKPSKKKIAEKRAKQATKARPSVKAQGKKAPKKKQSKKMQARSAKKKVVKKSIRKATKRK